MKIRPLSIALFLFQLAAPALGAVPSSDAQSPIVDQIELVGVTRFGQSDLEKLIEIEPGERYSRTKAADTAKNLTELYRSSGYEEARIQSRMVQRAATAKAPQANVFEIAVSEGRPTRVADISVVYDQPKWTGKLESASRRIGLAPGDVYDREKLLNGYRAVQDALTSYDFLSPRVSDAAVETVPPPPGTPNEVAEKTARWVRLRVDVELGERIEFAYRGNAVFTNGQLSSWIEEQRLVGFSQDYVERIRTRFEDEYRKLGYDRVKIEVFTFEDAPAQKKRILYVFDEGARVEVDSIAFDGNSVFSSEQLSDKFNEFATPMLGRGYYVAQDVEKTAQVLVEWMKSQGYLAAKLVSIARTYRPAGDRVSILIYLYEGDQTITEDVRVPGLTVLSMEEARKILGVAPGTPLNLYALNEGIEALKARYRDLGYLDVAITNEGTSKLVLYSHENRSADVVVELSEGTRYHVTRIEIEGLQKTKPGTVTRELEVKEGDVLSERLWYRSEAKLRRLGVFGTASIKAFPDPDHPDGKILRITIEEASPGLVAGGIGFRNDLGARVFGQVQYANVGGNGQTVVLGGNANRRFKGFGDTSFCPSTRQQAESPNDDHCFIEYDLSLGYIWPYFMLGDTTFRPRVSLENMQFKNFDARTVAAQTSWERPLSRNLGLTGVFTYSIERIKQYDANDDDDDRELRIGSMSPTLILDRRDSALAPTKGFYDTLQFDLARPEFGSQHGPSPIAYWRFQSRNDLYVPLPKGIDLYLSFRTGLEYNLARPPEGATGSDYAIPIIKQYTLGGVSSLRGFQEQSLNAGNFAIHGSLTYVNYRAQLDLPFAGSMKFGPFIDAANLNVDHFSLGNNPRDYTQVNPKTGAVETYTFGKLRYGVGVGLHYRSPVGPVNFDFGVNPAPQPGEDSFRLHFSIGNI